MSRKPRLSTVDHLAMVNHIAKHAKVHGYAPSIRELAEWLRGKSHSAVQWRLRILIEKGYLTRTPGVSRGIRVTKKGKIAVRKYREEVDRLTEEWRQAL